jgi:uncharacterized membrane protein
MLTRIGTPCRNVLAVVALISLATIGACHESSTEPDDPQTYDLQARQMIMRSPSASMNGGVVQAGWNLAQNKKAASMIGSTIGAIGGALATSARK